MFISEFHFFQLEETHVFIFADIVLKMFYKHGIPRSEKEPTLKALKLSKNYFDLLVYISQIIDCYIHNSANVLQLS